MSRDISIEEFFFRATLSVQQMNSDSGFNSIPAEALSVQDSRRQYNITYNF